MREDDEPEVTEDVVLVFDQWSENESKETVSTIETSMAPSVLDVMGRSSRRLVFRPARLCERVHQQPMAPTSDCGGLTWS